jgi:hypothetical protein
MREVYNDSQAKIGHFDGRFVYSLTGQKMYWIDESEVFSLPDPDDGHQLGARPSIKIGELTGNFANNSNDEVIFFIK